MSDCGGRSGTGTVFLRILWFSTVSITPPVLHTYLGLRAALTRTRLGTFQNAILFGNRGALDTKVLSLFAFKGLITYILTLVYTDRYVSSLQMRASCIQVCQITVTTRCRTVQPPPWRRSLPWQPVRTPDRGKL